MIEEPYEDGHDDGFNYDEINDSTEVPENLVLRANFVE